MKGLKTKLMKGAAVALSVAMLTPTVAVFAEDTELTAPGSAQCEVKKVVASSYSVLIPKEIDMGSEDVKEFAVQAKGSIAPQESVVVSVADTVEMKEENTPDYTGEAQMVFEDGTWSSDALTSEYTSKTGTVMFPETKAGTYSGTVTFDISLDTAE